MKVALLGIGIVALCLGAGLFFGRPHNDSRGTPWNPKAAAAYLDQREGWWMAWPPATRDHGTFCVSCHTAVPYALARPALRKALAEEGPSPNERKLLENVTKRVRLWKDVQPFYGGEKAGDEKRIQSRSTEAVLNALILASSAAWNGRLSDDTRTALDNMWALQETAAEAKNGAWSWLDFGNEPWEGKDSEYYGAALAAVAVGTAPENYRGAPEIQEHLKHLRGYLNRECARQSLINQVLLLWSSAKLPGLLDRGRQASIIQEVLSKQRADGGWSLSSLAWTWRSWSLYSLAKMWIRSEAPLEGRSDGYATGLIVFALQKTGFPPENVSLQRGLAWLARNQNQPEGLWEGYSLNKRHGSASDTSYFMNDAATAYAVLALTQ
jgi:squalene-hopene/tetraprenyl-beta-curcumene cyclase